MCAQLAQFLASNSLYQGLPLAVISYMLEISVNENDATCSQTTNTSINIYCL